LVAVLLGAEFDEVFVEFGVLVHAENLKDKTNKNG
jgi:hypothetical protein